MPIENILEKIESKISDRTWIEENKKPLETYPPHFHVEYNEHKASIDINTFGVMEGKLPSKVLGLVVEWAEDHQDELMKNWNDIKETGEWHKIEPLV